MSTDYVFDGNKPGPYIETDPVNPRSIYGATKQQGECAVRSANNRHIILRTAWVFSPFGSNFLKTMLNLAKTRDELRVVGDQYGSPTSAFVLADAIGKVLHQWTDDPSHGSGETFHVACNGRASWCEFAAQILDESRSAGGPGADVQAIATSDWPTKAKRPQNSVLDCTKFESCFNVRLPDWQSATAAVVRRLVTEQDKRPRR